ncbi:MAG TPA: hypothetical protein VE781_09710 [Kineosporiaceae bacterium]|jgi:hypothetical protein|nr:hypothetical protein [Kineosporiaceae bacterium]
MGRDIAGLLAVLLCAAGCTLPADPGRPADGAARAPDDAIPSATVDVPRSARAPSGRHGQGGARTAPTPRGLVQYGASQSASRGDGWSLVAHVAYVCAPHPDGGTCTLDLLDLEQSTVDWVWAFVPSASTNIVSIDVRAGRLHPGEALRGVDVEVAGCPAVLVLADDEHAHVNRHDLCLE